MIATPKQHKLSAVAVFLSAIMASSLTGCTVAQTAQFAVARYCWLPSEARAVSREAAAIATSPNRIEIHCHE